MTQQLPIAFRALLGMLLISLFLVQCKSSSDPVAIPKSSVKTFTSPTLEGVTSTSVTFDASTSTYMVTVPPGTTVSALKLTFTLPTGATAKPASGSVQDFTNPVTYTVTAEDGSIQTYQVVVTTPAMSITGRWRYESTTGCTTLVSSIYEVKGTDATIVSVPSAAIPYGFKPGDKIISTITMTTSPNNYSATGYTRNSSGNQQDVNIKINLIVQPDGQSVNLTYSSSACDLVQKWVKTN